MTHFYRVYIHHELVLTGGPMTYPSKLKMAGGGRVEFSKMLISLYLMKIFPQNWYRDAT